MLPTQRMPFLFYLIRINSPCHCSCNILSHCSDPTIPLISVKMPSLFSQKTKVTLLLALLIMLTVPRSSGEFEQWCVADEQTPDAELQAAMDWACGQGGADCSKIQKNQPCYNPNTVRDHASYTFNSYFQKMKHKGGSCYFRGAAMITELDPSHAPCKYEFFP